MTDVTVRGARLQDLEGLVEPDRGHVRDYHDRPRPSPDQGRILLGTLLFEKEGTVLVAEQEGRVAGFAILYFTLSMELADKIAVLNDIHVVGGGPGDGRGVDGVRCMPVLGEENGFANLTWQVTKDNHMQAQRFFERMGAAGRDWISYLI
jgi:hypothetical protein